MNQKCSETTELRDIISRAQAKHIGAKKYFTGKPCHKGHVTYRYTASGLCARCAHFNFVEGKNSPAKPEVRKRALKKWNASAKAAAAKQRWKEKDPKRAWAVYATGGAKERAARLGRVFDLDSEYVRGITPNKCPVFGTAFTFIGGKKTRPESPTIDCIKPELGYVRGNVAVISMKANQIKSNATAEEIACVAEWVKAQGDCYG